jgi:hypothetical protein
MPTGGGGGGGPQSGGAAPAAGGGSNPFSVVNNMDKLGGIAKTLGMTPDQVKQFILGQRGDPSSALLHYNDENHSNEIRYDNAGRSSPTYDIDPNAKFSSSDNGAFNFLQKLAATGFSFKDQKDAGVGRFGDGGMLDGRGVSGPTITTPANDNRPKGPTAVPSAPGPMGQLTPFQIYIRQLAGLV